MLRVLPPVDLWALESGDTWALSYFYLLCDFGQMPLLRWGLFPPKGAHLGVLPGMGGQVAVGVCDSFLSQRRGIGRWGSWD